MGLFGEEQDDLPEIISDERLVRVPTEAPEREPNQFLEKQEVLLLVGVELMEGVQLVRGALQSEDEVVGQQLHDVLVERLSLVVVGTVGFNQHELQTEICTIFSIVYQISEKLVHVGLEDVPEIDGIVNLRKNQHEILEMALLVDLLIRMQVVHMQQLKDPQTVPENRGKNAALLCCEGALVRQNEVYGFEGGDFHGVVYLQILRKEGFGNFMGESDALLQQLRLHLPHVHRVVAQPDRVGVEAQLVLLLIDSDELVLDHADSQQRAIYFLVV
jgi:hypothetical protein